MSTKIIPVTDLRRKTNEVLKEVQSESDVIYVTQHGRPAIVLMDYDHYEMLMEQLEELLDLVSLQNAAAESTRPYEEFLAEFSPNQANDQSQLEE